MQEGGRRVELMEEMGQFLALRMERASSPGSQNRQENGLSPGVSRRTSSVDTP